MTEGAFRVLDDFEAVDASTDGMKALTLQPEEEHAFATAALGEGRIATGREALAPVAAATPAGLTGTRGWVNLPAQSESE